MIIHWDQCGGLQQTHLIYKSNMKTHLIITGEHKTMHCCKKQTKLVVQKKVTRTNP